VRINSKILNTFHFSGKFNLEIQISLHEIFLIF
jgi:hypothetical protein